MKTLTIKMLAFLFILLASMQMAQAQSRSVADKNGEYVIIEVTGTASNAVQNLKNAQKELLRYEYVEFSSSSLPSYVKDDVWCKVSAGDGILGAYIIECYPANTQGFGVTIKAAANSVKKIYEKLLIARGQQRLATTVLKLPK